MSKQTDTGTKPYDVKLTDLLPDGIYYEGPVLERVSNARRGETLTKPSPKDDDQKKLNYTIHPNA